MYRVVVYPEAAEQIGALPAHLLPDLFAAVDSLAAAPWVGESHNADYPDAPVRRRLFGPLGMCQVVYLVLERDREAHLLRIVWLELPES